MRPEIKDAIQKCHKAGIRVIMCTGDNLDTAKAISLDAGILEGTKEERDSKYACMTGKDFREACGGLTMVEETTEGENVTTGAEDED